jgi:hypothetical protein
MSKKFKRYRNLGPNGLHLKAREKGSAFFEVAAGDFVVPVDEGEEALLIAHHQTVEAVEEAKSSEASGKEKG